MKNITITIFVVLVVAVLGLYAMSFQVNETQVALLTTFGKATTEDEITKPGWHFQWPWPVQKVYKFDARMNVLEAEMEETTTSGHIPIIVNTYLVWKIAEPLKFANSVGTTEDAEKKLLSLISDSQNSAIGRHSFSEFVNSDPDKIKLPQIEQEIFSNLSAPARDEYGIEVCTFGIKRLKINESATEKVFERMKSDRDRITQNITSQGESEATKIRSDADSKKAELLAAAQARAKAIRGEGDAEAAKHYKALEDDPELAMFLREMEALKKMLAERTTIVFSADSDIFKYLKKKPELEPKK